MRFLMAFVLSGVLLAGCSRPEFNTGQTRQRSADGLRVVEHHRLLLTDSPAISWDWAPESTGFMYQRSNDGLDNGLWWVALNDVGSTAWSAQDEVWGARIYSPWHNQAKYAENYLYPQFLSETTVLGGPMFPGRLESKEPWGEVLAIDIGTGEARVLGPLGTHVEVSPDSSKVLLQLRDGLRLSTANGDVVRDFPELSEAVWMPDSQRFVARQQAIKKRLHHAA